MSFDRYNSNVDSQFEAMPDTLDDFLRKYSEDQPRDAEGRFAGGDSSVGGSKNVLYHNYKKEPGAVGFGTRTVHEGPQNTSVHSKQVLHNTGWKYHSTIHHPSGINNTENNTDVYTHSDKPGHAIEMTGHHHVYSTPEHWSTGYNLKHLQMATSH